MTKICKIAKIVDFIVKFDGAIIDVNFFACFDKLMQYFWKKMCCAVFGAIVISAGKIKHRYYYRHRDFKTTGPNFIGLCWKTSVAHLLNKSLTTLTKTSRRGKKVKKPSFHQYWILRKPMWLWDFLVWEKLCKTTLVALYGVLYNAISSFTEKSSQGLPPINFDSSPENLTSDQACGPW